MVSDREILEAALLGFQAQLKEVEAKISEIRTQLAVRTAAARTPEVTPKAKAGRPKAQPAAAEVSGKKKRIMSASARERIAEAQKRRWAAHHAKQGEQ